MPAAFRTAQAARAAAAPRSVVLGVDTHKDVHVAGVLDHLGGLLHTREFPATASGYRQLGAETWLLSEPFAAWSTEAVLQRSSNPPDDGPLGLGKPPSIGGQGATLMKTSSNGLVLLAGVADSGTW